MTKQPKLRKSAIAGYPPVFPEQGHLFFYIENTTKTMGTEH
jgi:hypothetical protein